VANDRFSNLVVSIVFGEILDKADNCSARLRSRRRTRSRRRRRPPDCRRASCGIAFSSATTSMPTGL
jgi:hypothetical protein